MSSSRKKSRNLLTPGEIKRFAEGKGKRKPKGKGRGKGKGKGESEAERAARIQAKAIGEACRVFLQAMHEIFQPLYDWVRSPEAQRLLKDLSLILDAETTNRCLHRNATRSLEPGVPGRCDDCGVTIPPLVPEKTGETFNRREPHERTPTPPPIGFAAVHANDERNLDDAYPPF